MPDNTERYIIELRDNFSPKLKAASNKLSAFEQQVGGVNSVLGKLGTLVSLAAIGAGIKKISDLGAAAESTRISFQVLTGNIQTGEKLLGELKNYANITPYLNKDILETGRLLLSFGITTQKILPTVKILGDIASGDAQKLYSLSLAFAQSQAAGRLMGQDLLQMINAGFNPLKVISDKTGLSMAQLKKKMEDGAISAKDVALAFRQATEEGGLFFQMTEKQSKTFGGRMSTLSDTIAVAFTKLGTSLNTALGPVLDKLILVFQKLSDPNAFKINELKTDQGSRGRLAGYFESFAEYSKLSSPEGKQLAAQMQQRILDEFPQFAKSFTGGVPTGLNAGALKNYLKSSGLQAEGLKSDLDAQIARKSEAISSFNTFLGEHAKGSSATDVKKSMEIISTLSDELKALVKQRKSLDVSKIPPSLKGLISADEKYDITGKPIAGSRTARDGSTKVDNEIRSGGVKNVVLNITKLVENINFTQTGPESYRQIQEMVTRTLLAAANDVNLVV